MRAARAAFAAALPASLAASTGTADAVDSSDCTVVVLNPGGFHFGAGPLRISTLLGSCVAITFWHPQRLIGGMCHYLLPQRRTTGWDGAEELDGRYADEALHLFRQQIQAARTMPDEYQVKIFGGGHQFFAGVTAASAIPQRNLQAAQDLLAGWGLTVAAQHVGGSGPRQVMLDVLNGDVWVRHTPNPVEGG